MCDRSQATKQCGALDVMSAALEATRSECERRARDDEEMARLRRERERSVETFAAEIRKIQEAHAAEVADLCARLEAADRCRAEAASNASASRAAVDEARAALRTLEESHTAQLLQLQAARDEALLGIHGKWSLVQQQLAATQQQKLSDEALLQAQLLVAIETTSRSHLAVQATGERSRMVVSRLRAVITDKEKTIVAAQSQAAAANQKLIAVEATHAEEMRVVTHKTQLLEQAVETERSRGDGAVARVRELSEAHDALRAKAAADMDEALRERQQLRDAVSALEADRRAADAKSQSLRGELMASAERATAAETRAAELQAALDASRAARDFAGSQLALADQQLQALRQELHDVLLAHQRGNGELERVRAAAADAATKEAAASAERDEAVIALSAARQEVAALREAVGSLKENLAAAEARAAAAQANANITTAQVAAAVGELATLREVASNAATESAAQSAVISALSAELAAKAADADEVLALRQRLEAAEASAANDRRVRAVAEESLATLQQDARRWGQQRAELSQALLRANDERDAARDELQRLQAQAPKIAASLDDPSLIAADGAAERVGDISACTAGDASGIDEGSRVLRAKLSDATQRLRDLAEENERLRGRLTLAEAHYASAETKLHHSMREGASTAMLLDRGLKTIQASAMLHAETAETKAILSQAAHTLRRALEEQGFEMASLPLAPTSNLDLPYLQQVLLDHTTLCAQQLQRLGARNGGQHAAGIPSAMKTPMVYRLDRGDEQ